MLEFTNGKIYIKSIKSCVDNEPDVKYQKIDIQNICQKITEVSQILII